MISSLFVEDCKAIGNSFPEQLLHVRKQAERTTFRIFFIAFLCSSMGKKVTGDGVLGQIPTKSDESFPKFTTTGLSELDVDTVVPGAFPFLI